MKTLTDFIKYLDDENIQSFTTKSIYERLYKSVNITKFKLERFIRVMKQAGLIQRVSEAYNCITICSGCYESGCIEPNRAPFNYWKRIKQDEK